jgi:hypothetical protein
MLSISCAVTSYNTVLHSWGSMILACSTNYDCLNISGFVGSFFQCKCMHMDHNVPDLLTLCFANSRSYCTKTSGQPEEATSGQLEEYNLYSMRAFVCASGQCMHAQLLLWKLTFRCLVYLKGCSPTFCTAALHQLCRMWLA